MKVLHKKTPYRVCPRCGAHLDAGETCDCRQCSQQKSELYKQLSLDPRHADIYRGGRA